MELYDGCALRTVAYVALGVIGAFFDPLFRFIHP